MKSAFISFHYTEEFDSLDRLLSNRVEGLVKSHDLSPVTGEILGGGQLTSEIKHQISQSSCLIAIMTKRIEKQNQKWATHQWVYDEFNHAKSINIPAIAIVDKDVDVEGMLQFKEYIKMDTENQLSAFLRLSATIGYWKKKSGKQIKLRVQPDQIVQNYGPNADWKYRLNMLGSFTEWSTVNLTEEQGGCFLYLPNVSDEATIQIQATSTGSIVQSKCCPQWVSINLKDGQNG